MVTIAPTKPNDEDANRIEKYGVIYLKLNNGFVRYKAKNFSPNEDFYMTRMDNILGFEYEYPEGTVQGYKFKDKYFEILREVAFSNYSEIIDSLKDYFSQFIWYSPVSKNVQINPNLSNIVEAVDEVREKRYK